MIIFDSVSFCRFEFHTLVPSHGETIRLELVEVIVLLLIEHIVITAKPHIPSIIPV